MKETKLQRSRRQGFERKVFVSVLRAAGNVVHEEYKFKGPTGKRRWRVDITVCTDSHTDAEIFAIEVEGLNGRHQSMKGFLADMEKYNELTIAGYLLLRFTTRQIGNGEALEALARAGVRVTAPRKPYPVRDASPAGEGK